MLRGWKFNYMTFSTVAWTPCTFCRTAGTMTNNVTNGGVKYSVRALLWFCSAWHFTFFKTRVSWGSSRRWLLPSAALRQSQRTPRRMKRVTTEKKKKGKAIVNIITHPAVCCRLRSASDKWPWRTEQKYSDLSVEELSWVELSDSASQPGCL